MAEKKEYQKTENNEFKHIAWGPSPTEPEVSEWKRMESLINIIKFEDQLKLTYRLNGANMDFVISAPSLGGIRISGEQRGFFEPEERENIRLKECEKELSFQTSNGTLFCLEKGLEWKIKIMDADHVLQHCFTGDSIRFGYNGTRLVKICLEFDIAPNDVLLGMGERFSEINQNGNRHFIWNTSCEYDKNSENLELWRAYKNIPLLHSSRGNTLFYSSYYPAVSDLGYTDAHKGKWEFWGPEFDLFIWTGSLRERIKSYVRLTGMPFLPPKWAFHYMAGAGNRFWYGENFENEVIPAKYLQVLKHMLEGYRRLGIPNISALYGEGEIADNKIAYELLNVQGTRMLRYNVPDYSVEEIKRYLPDVPEEDFPRIRMMGEQEDNDRYFLDFFNANAKTLIRNRYNDCFVKGMRGGLLAYDELISEDAVYCNGITGKTMHNWNSYWYMKLHGEAAYEIVGNDYIYFCRGGCAGSQQWAAVYSGNQPAALYGLRQQLRAALSIGLCGFSVWGGDMAGYEGIPDEETFIRGIEFSTFQPLMRSHGENTRCPWDFGKEAESIFVKYYWLRENLLNLLYSAAILSNHKGVPIMEAMALAFPEEKEYLDNDRQYRFCNTLLVAPVLEHEAKTKKVFFPKGKWFELWSGTVVEGGTEQEIPVSLRDCPVYFKAGVVVPVIMNKKIQWALPFSEKTATDVMVITPPDKESEYRYYADEKDKYTFKCVRESDKRFTVYSLKNITIKKLFLYGKVSSIEVNGESVEFKVIHSNENVTVLEVKTEEWNRLTITCK